MQAAELSVGERQGWRYLATLCSITMAFMLALVLSMHAALSRHIVQIPVFYLFEYQINKLRAAGPVDTVFVGDSSLGNAIDAESFSQLTGSRALNLALTGTYGFAGTLNMMRLALQHSQPKNVVIVQTANILSVRFFPVGYFATLPSGDLSYFEFARGISEYVRILLQADTILNFARQMIEPPERTFPIVDDYMQQNPEKIQIPRDADFSAPYQDEQIDFLKAIVATCKDRRLNCVYATGPVSEVFCRNSSSYLAASSAVIRQAGLVVAAGAPLCISDEDLGDGWDHVAHGAKQRSTSRFFEILQPYLK